MWAGSRVVTFTLLTKDKKKQNCRIKTKPDQMKPRIIRRNQNLSGPVILGLRIKGHKEALEIARNGRLWPIFPNGFQKNARWPSTHALTRSFSGQDEACKPSNLSASVWILSSSVDIQLVRCSTFCSHFYISLCSWMFLQSCSVNKISVVYSRTQGLTLFCLKNDNIFTLYLVPCTYTNQSGGILRKLTVSVMSHPHKP